MTDINIKYKNCKICGLNKPETIEYFSIRSDNLKFRNECLDCKKEYERQYVAKNKDKISEYGKQYHKDNKDILEQKSKIYRENHKQEKSIYDHQYRESNKELISKKQKQYRENNKEIIASRKKEYYDQNKEDIRKDRKIYRQNNKNKINEQNKKYRENNKDKIRIIKRKYQKNRMNTDMEYKLHNNISSLVRNTIHKNGGRKNKKSVLNYLPFSIEELILHLEELFEPWMNWKNWGKYNSKTWDNNDPSTWTWNIDHIIPRSDLPYNSMEHPNFKKCWALNNLRPLNAKLNILEGANKIRHIK